MLKLKINKFIIPEIGITENDINNNQIENTSYPGIESFNFQSMEPFPVNPFYNHHKTNESQYFYGKCMGNRKQFTTENPTNIVNGLRYRFSPEKDPCDTGDQEGDQDLKTFSK